MRARAAVVLVLSVLSLLVAGPASASPGPIDRPGSLFKNSLTKASHAATVTPAAAPAMRVAPAKAPAPSAMAVYQSRVLTLSNIERSQRGLRPLALSSCADGFADRWASQIAANGALSHQSLTTVLGSCHANRAGENVAYGNVTADQMVAMWMASPGHRANLLNPNYTHLGVGSVQTSNGRVYGVQDFLTL